MCNRLIAGLFFVSFLDTVGFWPGFLVARRFISFDFRVVTWYIRDPLIPIFLPLF